MNKFPTSYYLEGLTHEVGNLLRDQMELLKAQTVTCFIGHEHSPGDLRLVYQKGLFYPETLYGVLSRRTVRQYLATANNSAFPQLQRYQQTEADLGLPAPFRRTPFREEYKASLQRLWRTGGCPNAMLFFNFRGNLPEGFERDSKVLQVFEELEASLLPIFKRFWDSPTPQEFTTLTRAAESIGGRVFFETKDFEFMSRAARNRAFSDLLTATIEADPVLKRLAPWWHLYGPVTSTTKPLDTKLVMIAQCGNSPAADSAFEIDVRDFDSVESWVYLRDTALRFSPQKLRGRKSGFLALLNHRHLKDCHALISLPFTSGDEIFAIATLGFTENANCTIPEITAAMNRATRSLWFNGRTISRTWSQANERRYAMGARRIVECFSSSSFVETNAPDNSTDLADLFCNNLEATECDLWEWRDDHFVLVSHRAGSRPGPPPRSDGWTHWVVQSNTPALFVRCSDLDGPSATAVFVWNTERNEWNELTSEQLEHMPQIRDITWEANCYTQLALPLKISLRERHALGAVWIQFDSSCPPEQVDIDLALTFARDIARMIAAGRRREEIVKEEKELEYERTLSHLRHETLKLVPQMIRKGLEDSRDPAKQESALSTLLDTADFLEATLTLYTTLDIGRLPSLAPCEVADAVQRAVRLATVSQNGSEPPVVFRPDLSERTGIVQIDRRLLWGVLLNLFSNARIYRYSKAPRRADENIYVHVRPVPEGAVVTVDDAGRGMRQAEKDLAGHDRFPHDPCRGDQGSGMGLFLSYRALKDFGSWRIVDSERGGTAFQITLWKG